MKYPALGPIVETGYWCDRSWMIAEGHPPTLRTLPPTPHTSPALPFPTRTLRGYAKLPLWHPWLELSNDELADQLDEDMPRLVYRDEHGWVGFRTDGPTDWWPDQGMLWLKVMKNLGRPVIEWNYEKVKFAAQGIIERAFDAESTLRQLPESWTSGAGDYLMDVAARARVHALRPGLDPYWAAERKELLSNGFGPWITNIEANEIGPVCAKKF